MLCRTCAALGDTARCSPVCTEQGGYYLMHPSLLEKLNEQP